MLVKDARWNQMQNIGPVADLDRMAGVRTALIAGDDVRFRTEDVDNLAFALISPLCANYDADCHDARSSCLRSTSSARARPPMFSRE